MPPEPPAWAKDERLGEVRGRINKMLREPDPLAGLPANAKRALARVGMADAPEKIARALQYRLVTTNTPGIGPVTLWKIERWLEDKGLIRVSKDENFFWVGSKKHLT